MYEMFLDGYYDWMEQQYAARAYYTDQCDLPPGDVWEQYDPDQYEVVPGYLDSELFDIPVIRRQMWPLVVASLDDHQQN